MTQTKPLPARRRRLRTEESLAFSLVPKSFSSPTTTISLSKVIVLQFQTCLLLLFTIYSCNGRLSLFSWGGGGGKSSTTTLSQQQHQQQPMKRSLFSWRGGGIGGNGGGGGGDSNNFPTGTRGGSNMAPENAELDYYIDSLLSTLEVTDVETDNEFLDLHNSLPRTTFEEDTDNNNYNHDIVNLIQQQQQQQQLSGDAEEKEEGELDDYIERLIGTIRRTPGIQESENLLLEIQDAYRQRQHVDQYIDRMIASVEDTTANGNQPPPPPLADFRNKKIMEEGNKGRFISPTNTQQQLDYQEAIQLQQQLDDYIERLIVNLLKTPGVEEVVDRLISDISENDEMTEDDGMLSEVEPTAANKNKLLLTEDDITSEDMDDASTAAAATANMDMDTTTDVDVYDLDLSLDPQEEATLQQLMNELEQEGEELEQRQKQLEQQKEQSEQVLESATVSAPAPAAIVDDALATTTSVDRKEASTKTVPSLPVKQQDEPLVSSDTSIIVEQATIPGIIQPGNYEQHKQENVEISVVSSGVLESEMETPTPTPSSSDSTIVTAEEEIQETVTTRSEDEDNKESILTTTESMNDYTINEFAAATKLRDLKLDSYAVDSIYSTDKEEQIAITDDTDRVEKATTEMDQDLNTFADESVVDTPVIDTVNPIVDEVEHEDSESIISAVGADAENTNQKDEEAVKLQDNNGITEPTTTEFVELSSFSVSEGEMLNPSLDAKIVVDGSSENADKQDQQVGNEKAEKEEEYDQAVYSMPATVQDTIINEDDTMDVTATLETIPVEQTLENEDNTVNAPSLIGTESIVVDHDNTIVSVSPSSLPEYQSSQEFDDEISLLIPGAIGEDEDDDFEEEYAFAERVRSDSDIELDEYIDYLISTVDDTDMEDDFFLQGEGHEGGSIYDELVEDAVMNSFENGKLTTSAVNSPTEAKNTLSKKKKKKKPKKKQKQKSKKLHDQAEKTASGDGVAIATEQAKSHHIASVNSEEKQVSDNKMSVVSSANDKKKTRSPDSKLLDKNPSPPPPPNAVYRFLLRQGPIGHTLAIALVLFVEWIRTYVPQLAECMSWMWHTCAPVSWQRRLQPPSSSGDRRTFTPAASSVQQKYKSRMPVKGKQRKVLSKKADQQALEQLRRVGDIRQAKYRHVSVDFLKLHGLGPFSNSRPPIRASEAVLADINNIGKDTPFTRKQAAVVEEEEEEEESDVDWVLKGLTSEKPRTTVSVGIGEKGPSVSVGFEFGVSNDNKNDNGNKKRPQQKSLLKDAITRDSLLQPTKKKKQQISYASDRDGGSGVVGRLRAAAGANSLMSRSLLGAYPGDLVPPSEAANAAGVIDLARKYGYGDWSDYDDDEYNDNEQVEEDGLFFYDDEDQDDDILGKFVGEHENSYDSTATRDTTRPSTNKYQSDAQGKRHRKKRKVKIRESSTSNIHLPSAAKSESMSTSTSASKRRRRKKRKHPSLSLGSVKFEFNGVSDDNKKDDSSKSKNGKKSGSFGDLPSSIGWTTRQTSSILGNDNTDTAAATQQQERRRRSSSSSSSSKPAAEHRHHESHSSSRRAREKSRPNAPLENSEILSSTTMSSLHKKSRTTMIQPTMSRLNNIRAKQKENDDSKERAEKD